MRRLLILILAAMMCFSCFAESSIMARSPTLKVGVDRYNYSWWREAEEIAPGSIQGILTVGLNEYSDQTGNVRWRFIVGDNTITKYSKAEYNVTLTEADIDDYLPDGDVVTIYVSGSVETPGGLKDLKQYAIQYNVSEFGKGADMIEGTWQLLTIERNRYYRTESSAILVRNSGDKCEVIELFSDEPLLEEYKSNAIFYHYYNEANWWNIYEYEVYVETEENEEGKEIITNITYIGYTDYEEDERYVYNGFEESEDGIDTFIFDFIIRYDDTELKYDWLGESYVINSVSEVADSEYPDEVTVTLGCRYMPVEEYNKIRPYNMFTKIACGFYQD